MQSLQNKIQALTLQALLGLFPEQSFDSDDITINETKADFEGDYTIVLFPFLKKLRTNPQQLGSQIGAYLVSNHKDLFASYSIVAGFLNLTISDLEFLTFLNKNKKGFEPDAFLCNDQKKMVEYSSPNTNKPLHFGHLRNIFLGWSVAEILKTTGNQVTKANLINDRGIHICKSMVAWQRLANNATPESTNTKGDHFVGSYYVQYNNEYKKEVATLVAAGQSQEEAEKNAPILLEAQELLRKWEANDEATKKLWKTMNDWVYAGFSITYNQMGVDFDQYYYESDTYLLGKEIVNEGLAKGTLFTKENGSVWIDLTDEGLDEKLLLRADGTSVYMTQDLGTAKLKHQNFGIEQSIYVIGDEQNYHMQVLKCILQKLGEPSGDGIYHLSYGMVELPSGRMKSREGTVVDADDMIAEMKAIAKKQTQEAGKTEGFSDAALQELYHTVGLGALKFYLLRVDPRKKMIFNPEESIDLHGFTASFIQYTYARIQSLLRKTDNPNSDFTALTLAPLEHAILLLLEQYPATVRQAAKELSPAVICNYTFKLAQTFNSFYEQHSISKAESPEHQSLRIDTAQLVATTIKHAMKLLGIHVPDKM